MIGGIRIVEIIQNIVEKGWFASIPLLIPLIITLITQLSSTSFEKLMFTPKVRLYTTLVKISLLSFIGVIIVTLYYVLFAEKNEVTNIADIITLFLIYFILFAFFNPIFKNIEKRYSYSVIDPISQDTLYIQRVTINGTLLLSSTQKLYDNKGYVLFKPLEYLNDKKINFEKIESKWRTSKTKIQKTDSTTTTV
jgi:hypothetical protein